MTDGDSNSQKMGDEASAIAGTTTLAQGNTTPNRAAMMATASAMRSGPGGNGGGLQQQMMTPSHFNTGLGLGQDTFGSQNMLTQNRSQSDLLRPPSPVGSKRKFSASVSGSFTGAAADKQVQGGYTAKSAQAANNPLLSNPTDKGELDFFRPLATWPLF